MLFKKNKSHTVEIYVQIYLMLVKALT